MITGGFFLFPWLVLMMNDVNAIEGRPALPASRYKAFFIVAIPLYAAVLAVPVFMSGPSLLEWVPLFSAAAVLCAALLVAIFRGVILISRYISRSQGRSYGFSGAIISVLLTLLFYASFIVIQRQLNHLPENL